MAKCTLCTPGPILQMGALRLEAPVSVGQGQEEQVNQGRPPNLRLHPDLSLPTADIPSVGDIGWTFP